MIPPELITLCEWLSDYYHHPFGDTLFTAIPSLLRQGKTIELPQVWTLTTEGKGLHLDSFKRSPRQKEIIDYIFNNRSLNQEQIKQESFSISAIKSLSDKKLIKKTTLELDPAVNSVDSYLLESPKTLNSEQRSVYEKIAFHIFNCYLINGVTGSGKTEIYLQLIDRALQLGKNALILVPEIGLTHQTLTRVKNRFSTVIVELHSNVSETKRGQNWIYAVSGKARIVIGTRLAALTPIANLGVIIIDEEHDQSYKQQDGLKYNARDLCIYRAKQESIPIVLGSATPSLESIKNSNEQRYIACNLTVRAGKAVLPRTEQVDLKDKNLIAGMANRVIEALRETLLASGQALVFINRRGFAPILQCHNCGWIAECRSCSSSLSYHKSSARLICHQCDRIERLPNACPTCNSSHLNTYGIGTEQLEEHLIKLFPDFPIYRIDRDSTRQKDSFKNQLLEINQGKPCILIGTQMLAKGHHLPNLQLAILLDTDQGLFSNDFRGVERMGQLVTQVAGRAGRTEKPGTVLIQTHYPDHPFLETLLNRGYTDFANQLLDTRLKANLPPYWHMATIRAESKRAEIAVEFLHIIKRLAKKSADKQPLIDTLGPIADKVEKINDRYRYVFQIISAKRLILHKTLRNIIDEIDRQPISKRTRWSVDVDPIG